jgi:hypothetical protein
MVFTYWRSSVSALLFLLLVAWNAQSLSIIGPELVKLPSRPVHLNLTGFEFDAVISNDTGELIYKYGYSAAFSCPVSEEVGSDDFAALAFLVVLLLKSTNLL